jgi:hypothetical protein
MVGDMEFTLDDFKTQHRRIAEARLDENLRNRD